MYYHRTTLYRILDSFLRHKWLFAITVSTIIGFVIAYTVLKPTTYTTAYTVLVKQRQIQNPLASQTEDPWTAINNMVAVMQVDVSTKNFLQAALTLPDGHEIPLNHPIDFRDDTSLIAMQHNISISNDNVSSFVVQMTYSDPDDSKAILRGIIAEFVRRDAQDKAAFYTTQKTTIAQQVEHYRALLSDSESRLAAFRTKNLQNMPGQSESTEAELISLKGQAADISNQIATTQERVAETLQQMQTTPKTITQSTTTVAEESPLKGRLEDLQQQLSEALMTMSEQHPVVIDIKARIKAVKQLMAQEARSGPRETTEVAPNPLYQSLNNQYVETKIDLDAYRRQLADVNQQITTTSAEAIAIPTRDKQLAELARNYSIYNQTYATLQNQLQVATLNEEINLRHTNEQYEPRLTMPPQSSSSTKKMAAIYIGGFVLAFFLGAAVVMFVEWTDRSFRDPSELERVLNVPVLAVLPEIEAPRGAADVNRRLLPQPDTGPGGKTPPKLLRAPTPAGASAAAASGSGGGKSKGWSPFRGTGDNPPAEDAGS